VVSCWQARVPDHGRVSDGTALVLVHDEVPGRGAAEVGSLSPALTEIGLHVVLATLVHPGPPLPEPGTVELLIVLGSSDAADDDTLPWLGPELAYVRRSIELGTPVLGICFGAQLLARVFGGTVGRAPRTERGFVALTSADESLLPSATWLEFHDDAFTLPPGAELIAANEVGVQAFRLGRHVGVQFHPEITPTAFAAWVDAWRVAGELDEVASAIDLPALGAEIDARSARAADTCRSLVRGFCAASIPGPVRPGQRGNTPAAGTLGR
jgi:GMP synthase (glutamine-hydrolysing)